MANYTDDLCVGGTATASSENAGREAPLAFDDDTGTSWYTGDAFPKWLKYDFGAGIAHIIIRVRWKGDGGGEINAFSIEGSNDDSAWDTLHSDNASQPDTTWQDFEFTNTTAYRYIRIYMTSGYDDPHSTIVECEMMAKAIPSGFMIFLSEAYRKGEEYFKKKLWTPKRLVLPDNLGFEI